MISQDTSALIRIKVTEHSLFVMINAIIECGKPLSHQNDVRGAENACYRRHLQKR
jgi:hypothetical protein